MKINYNKKIVNEKVLIVNMKTNFVYGKCEKIK